MIIQICVGSACYLKGSQEIVDLFQKAIEKYDLMDEVALAGSFCIGKCNREGVTVQIDDEVHLGITKEVFPRFFEQYVLEPLKIEGGIG